MDELHTFEKLPRFLVGTTYFQIPMMLPQITCLRLLIHKSSAIFISYSSLSSNHGTFDQELSSRGWKRQLCEVSALHETSIKITHSINLDITWRKLVSGNFPQTISLPEIPDRFTAVIFISGMNFPHRIRMKCLTEKSYFETC